jgi:hypothetical protein
VLLAIAVDPERHEDHMVIESLSSMNGSAEWGG